MTIILEATPFNAIAKAAVDQAALSTLVGTSYPSTPDAVRAAGLHLPKLPIGHAVLRLVLQTAPGVGEVAMVLSSSPEVI
jgi:hypothetical protein